MLPLDMFTVLVDRDIALFDLDMTLIDVRDRYHKSLEDLGISPSIQLYKLSRKERKMFWRVFLSEKYIHMDKPIRESIRELTAAYNMGMGIIILTGRPSKLRRATIEQLDKFGISYHHLIMRPANIREPDYKLKPKIIGEMISLGLRIMEYHEDDIRIINIVKRKYPWIETCLHRHRGFNMEFNPPEETRRMP
jgi:phosphoglycolate phosphatase-like HAD superfamily hydrolase